MTLRLIYASKRAPGVTENDFRVIAMFSAINNKHRGITGLLLQFGDEIMQVLEGPKAAVEALYTKIEADPRHIDVKVVSRTPFETRQFGDWSMGYRQFDNAFDKDLFFALSSATMDEIKQKVGANDVGDAVSEFADRSGL